MLLLYLLLLVAATSSPASVAGEGGAEPVVNDFSHVYSSTDGPQQLYQPNSTFAANLAAMSAALPRNASASSGFSAGAKDVTIFYDQCHVRFHDRDFLAGAGNSPKKVAHNMNNVSTGNVAEFDGLVTRLANAVADRASNASSKYATGQAGFAPDKINLYGLAQCTPDLTTAQCLGCLAGIIGQIPKSLSGRLGGRILGVRCNFRYEKDIFFAVPDDILTLMPLVTSSSSTGEA
ncbi:hypothetical protein ACQ4PT_071546 [Festuca glaucescens]